MQSFKDWIYKTFIHQLYVKSTKSAYDMGYLNGLKEQRLKYELDALERMKSWTIDPEKVIGYMQNGTILLNGQEISERQLKNLKAEVRGLKTFELYEIFINTVRKLAIDKAVLKASDLYSLKGNEEVLAGKMMVFNLDVLSTIVNRIDKAKIK
jgi:hypothetical protein